MVYNNIKSMFMNDNIINKKIKDEIKKIKMLCDEDKYKKIPEDMINFDGKKNYAYVMGLPNEKYISGSIVLVDSIHKLGSMSDLIVVISNNFSNEAKEILKKFFDRIIEIEEKDNILINIEFLKLTEYKKVIVLDPNSLILKFPDHIFSLECPATIYLEHEIYNNNNNNESEYIYELTKQYEKYCDCYFHGSKIKDISIVKNSKINFWLLQPNLKDYNLIKKKVEKNVEKKITEQQILQKYYKDNLFAINPIFMGLNGLPIWSLLFGLTFVGEIPYILESKIPIEERVKNVNFQLWHKFYADILNRYPEILDSVILKETNDISKFFINPLARKNYLIKKALSEGLTNSISNIFKIKNPKNSYYYHINISKEYDNDAINYLFEDDFIQNMLNDILRYNNSLYWRNILKKINIKNNLTDNAKSNKINNELLDNFKLEDKENIISYYTKINSNVSIILVITTEKNEENFWLDNNLISNIFYKKYLEINGIVLKNILFNINQIYSYEERKIMLNCLYSDYTNYKVQVLIYKTLIDSNLKGNSKDIYVFSDTNSKLRASSILFNQNTLNKFYNKEINFMDNKKINNQIYTINILIFQSLKKWIYNNYDGNEIENVIVVNNFDFNNKKLINYITLVDMNIYIEDDDYAVKNFNRNKLYFLNTIFMSKLSKKSKLYLKYEFLIDNINDSRYYYQIDGIKFII